MEIDLREWSKEQFKAAQRPIAWLLSVERLRDAAEAICKADQAAEISYFQAHAVAEKQAVAEAYSDGNDAGVAEIKAMPPNYPPAQLLYAFAIENVLKGLIVANTPGLIEEHRLNNDGDVIEADRQTVASFNAAGLTGARWRRAGLVF